MVTQRRKKCKYVQLSTGYKVPAENDDPFEFFEELSLSIIGECFKGKPASWNAFFQKMTTEIDYVVCHNFSDDPTVLKQFIKAAIFFGVMKEWDELVEESEKPSKKKK